MDKTPDVSSPEVQEWIKEVNASGITIPDIAPTVAGGCGSNPQAAADTSRCWWTCGGCVDDDDVEKGWKNRVRLGEVNGRDGFVQV